MEIKENTFIIETDLKYSEKEIDFNIPFNVIFNIMSEVYPYNIAKKTFVVYIDPNIFNYCNGYFNNTNRQIIDLAIRANEGNPLCGYIEILDEHNGSIFSFSVPFDNNTKLSNGKALVDTLLTQEFAPNKKRFVMKSQDIDKILVDMSPDFSNYRELSRRSFGLKLIEKTIGNSKNLENAEDDLEVTM